MSKSGKLGCTAEMHNNDFEAPPLQWSILSVLGGITTAILIIWGLEVSVDRLHSVPDHSAQSADPIESPQVLIPTAVD